MRLIQTGVPVISVFLGSLCVSANAAVDTRSSPFMHQMTNGLFKAASNCVLEADSILTPSIRQKLDGYFKGAVTLLYESYASGDDSPYTTAIVDVDGDVEIIWAPRCGLLAGSSTVLNLVQTAYRDDNPTSGSTGDVEADDGTDEYGTLHTAYTSMSYSCDITANPSSQVAVQVADTGGVLGFYGSMGAMTDKTAWALQANTGGTTVDTGEEQIHFNLMFSDVPYNSIFQDCKHPANTSFVQQFAGTVVTSNTDGQGAPYNINIAA